MIQLWSFVPILYRSGIQRVFASFKFIGCSFTYFQFCLILCYFSHLSFCMNPQKPFVFCRNKIGDCSAVAPLLVNEDSELESYKVYVLVTFVLQYYL